ncbi:PQQ-binding-like beta-propeller repeat protein [Streptomyces sp. NPDC057386]|uniref:protein kinase domain-containing protein n=1 Tax=unclassified Streptomyces TaxID=2593676 RepID=UPI003633B629
MQALRATDPRRIGPYEVVGRLGAGGMGEVYLAVSRAGLRLAVKVVRAEHAEDRTFRARFRHEVRAAQTVGGAGTYTARVVDADTEAERPWMATEFVDGPNLRDAVLDGGPLPLDGVRALAAALGEALAAIHAKGMVHRDLKPSNILLAPDGPRVIDFGIVRALEATSLTRTGTVVGSVGYVSPEQIRNGGEVGPPSDVFSLGAVLAYASAGREPFGEGQDSVVLLRILTRDYDLTGVPDGIRPLVEACFAEDPQKRPTPQRVIVAVGHTPTTLRSSLRPGWYGQVPEPATGAGPERWLPARDSGERPSGVEYVAPPTVADMPVRERPGAPDAAPGASGSASDAPAVPAAAPDAHGVPGVPAPASEVPAVSSPAPGALVPARAAEESPAAGAVASPAPVGERRAGAAEPAPAVIPEQAQAHSPAPAPDAAPSPEPAPDRAPAPAPDRAAEAPRVPAPASPSAPAADAPAPAPAAPAGPGALPADTPADTPGPPSAEGPARRRVLGMLAGGAVTAAAGAGGWWLWGRNRTDSGAVGPDETDETGDAAEPGRTPRASGTGGATGKPVLLWQYDVGGLGGIDGPCAAVSPDGSTVYAASVDGTLHAVSADGVKRWSVKLSGQASTPVATSAGVFCIAWQDEENGSRKLYALRPDGARRWERTLGVNGYDRPTLLDGDILVALGDSDAGGLRRITADGSTVWTATTPAGPTDTPLVADGVVYTGSYGDRLLALNASDGTRRWSVPGGLDVAAPVLAGDILVAHSGGETNRHAFRRRDGKLLWEKTGEENGLLLPGDDDLVIAVSAGTLQGLRAADGSIAWTYYLPEAAADPGVGVSGGIVYARVKDQLHAVGTDGKARWTATVGSAAEEDAAHGPLVHGRRIYVSSGTGIAAVDLPA